jgi:hypothetical protein
MKRLLILVIAFLFFGSTAQAIPIYNIPNFSNLAVNFISGRPSSTWSAGFSKDELLTQPDSWIHKPIITVGNNIFGGLTDENGDLAAGDDYFTLFLGAEGGSNYWLDGIALRTSTDEEGTTDITTTSDIVLTGWKLVNGGFRTGATIDDLSLTLGIPDTDSIELLSGIITYGFTSSEPASQPASQPIPEPSTIILLGIGLFGVAVVKIRNRIKCLPIPPRIT